jgi:hypothetical protein
LSNLRPTRHEESNQPSLRNTQSDSNGHWQAPMRVPTPSGSTFAGFSISCLAKGDCLAVGELLHGGMTFPASTMEINGRWTPAQRIAFPKLHPKVGSGVLGSISCTPARECVAVGSFSTTRPKSYYPGAVTFANGKWGPPNLLANVPALPNGTRDAWFTSVSCPSSLNCIAIGGRQFAVRGRIRSGNFSAVLAPPH